MLSLAGKQAVTWLLEIRSRPERERGGGITEMKKKEKKGEEFRPSIKGKKKNDSVREKGEPGIAFTGTGIEKSPLRRRCGL